MLKPAIPPLLHAHLFGNLKPNDPTSFQAHLTRNLLPEVRQETARFYGPSDCLEAQYPGLDYTNPAHRSRLTRYPWHRRLFRAFDELRLAPSEIEALCRWEGTKYARQKYERDNDTIVRDTTWDEVEVPEHREAVAVVMQLRGGSDDMRDRDTLKETKAARVNVEDETEKFGEETLEESEDELEQSIGVELNRRLIAASEARARGEEVIMDEDWEQWLKEAAERSGQSSSSPSSDLNLDPVGNPTYGQMLPVMFGSNLTPQVQAVQARLPPPPRYTNYVQGTPTAPATGTAM